MAAAVDHPPQTVLAEVNADPRLAETWLREMARQAQEQKNKRNTT